MVWLGEVSFGFYMSQHVLLYTLRVKIQHGAHYAPLPATALILGAFAVTILAGWLLYRLVELPAMNRWATARRPELPRETAAQASAPAPAEEEGVEAGAGVYS
jgi:peptidoglycan/LPS O-acetylase OafA/YrhL